MRRLAAFAILFAAAVTAAADAQAQSGGRRGAGVCDLLARDAAQMVIARDRGRTLDATLRAIAIEERAALNAMTNPPRELPTAVVARAMAMEIYADEAMTPQEAAAMSRRAPCGWPGVNPHATAQRQ